MIMVTVIFTCFKININPLGPKNSLLKMHITL